MLGPFGEKSQPPAEERNGFGDGVLALGPAEAG